MPEEKQEPVPQGQELDLDLGSEIKFEDDEILLENSPLAQADPKALDELFSRIDSSLKLDQVPDMRDVSLVVLTLRRQRQKFLSEEANRPVKTPAEKRAAKAKDSNKPIKSVKQVLNLDDLL